MNTPSFAAGTPVATSLDASGHLATQNIQDVQVGDLARMGPATTALAAASPVH